MANGHIEIHDPLPKQDDPRTRQDPAPTSDTDAMEDTAEFRLLMAYAKRRRAGKDGGSPKQEAPAVPNGTASPQTPATKETEEIERKKKKKTKKVWKRLPSILRCIKPQTDEGEPPQKPKTVSNDGDRCSVSVRMWPDAEDKTEDRLGDVANRLTKIADEIPFTPPDLEHDSPDDDVEKMIGLLLRESGDRLNERELKDFSLAREIFWNYSFFEAVIKTLLTRMGLRSPNPDSPGPHASPKTQIAVTCEATNRLSAMATLPTSQLLGYGARYLSDHYSSWVQEQGGYDAAFESDDENEVQ